MQLYTLDRPVGGLEELLDWDQGMGVHHPAFMDVLVPSGAPDPVDFNVSMSLAEQIDDWVWVRSMLQKLPRMDMDIDELEDIMEGAVEDSFVGSWGPDRSLLAREPPLGDLD
ncbi:hypothetical protein DCAR_0519636 [Daucus carota subsp. sativus]|uniref:Uncharacterized protein n=1 Tax=Daucus carota subsp. sativus TaxID=79200 RepID=A0A164Y3P1_DAUCS|nr:hypothetical protein DCAR_0519636 [Daucus carota subsp. sativus]